MAYDGIWCIWIRDGNRPSQLFSHLIISSHHIWQSPIPSALSAFSVLIFLLLYFYIIYVFLCTNQHGFHISFVKNVISVNHALLIWKSIFSYPSEWMLIIFKEIGILLFSFATKNYLQRKICALKCIYFFYMCYFCLMGAIYSVQLLILPFKIWCSIFQYTD